MNLKYWSVRASRARVQDTRHWHFPLFLLLLGSWGKSRLLPENILVFRVLWPYHLSLPPSLTDWRCCVLHMFPKVGSHAQPPILGLPCGCGTLTIQAGLCLCHIIDPPVSHSSTFCLSLWTHQQPSIETEPGILSWPVYTPISLHELLCMWASWLLEGCLQRRSHLHVQSMSFSVPGGCWHLSWAPAGGVDPSRSWAVCSPCSSGSVSPLPGVLGCTAHVSALPAVPRCFQDSYLALSRCHLLTRVLFQRCRRLWYPAGCSLSLWLFSFRFPFLSPLCDFWSLCASPRFPCLSQTYFALELCVCVCRSEIFRLSPCFFEHTLV